MLKYLLFASPNVLNTTGRAKGCHGARSAMAMTWYAPFAAAPPSQPHDDGTAPSPFLSLISLSLALSLGPNRTLTHARLPHTRTRSRSWFLRRRAYVGGAACGSKWMTRASSKVGLSAVSPRCPLEAQAADVGAWSPGC